MATTIAVSNTERTVFGNKRIVFADLTFASTNYPTGGVSLIPSDLGLTGIDFVKVENASLVYKFDYTNNKLLAYTVTGTSPGATKVLVEAIDADPAETVKVFVIGWGKN